MKDTDRAFKKTVVRLAVLSKAVYEWDSVAELAASMCGGENEGDYDVESVHMMGVDGLYNEAARLGLDPSYWLPGMEGDLKEPEGKAALVLMLRLLYKWLTAKGCELVDTASYLAGKAQAHPCLSSAVARGYVREDTAFLTQKGWDLLALWRDRGIGVGDYDDNGYKGPLVLAYMLPEELI